jgi:glycosyltransferase involved in cell wall biosynthesis
VVIDDASTDSTLKIVKKYRDKRIKLYSNDKNLGIAKNMNKGIRLSHGKYLAIMDADDWSYPYRIEEQVHLMEENPEVVLCSGYMDICDENLSFKNTRTYPITDKDIRKAIVRYDPISHPASIWRMSELLKTGLYNDKFPICRDYDLVVRISEYGKYQNIPKPIIKYRVRRDSETGKRIRQTQWYSFYIQMKAHFEYSFSLRFSDILFIIMRLFATILLPTSWQRKIANRFSK